jgi:hypothetical protein
MMEESRRRGGFVRQSNLNSKERFKVILDELKGRRNRMTKSHIPNLIQALRISIN